MKRPLASDYTVVWHNPDREYYVEGSGLVHLGDAHWLSIVPVVPRNKATSREILIERRVSQSRVHVIRSTDDGKSWDKISEVPYYSAVSFLHQGAVYLFANKGGTEFRNDDLLLLRSDDHGQSWSEPVTLFKGHFWNCQTSMTIKNDRLYWAVDDLSYGKKRGPKVVAGDLKSDLMSTSNWRASNTIPFPGISDELINANFSGKVRRYLEPNVININGTLRVLARAVAAQQTTTNLAAVLDLEDDESGDMTLSFTQYHPMPGGHLKFCIARDEVTEMFWMAANLSADGQGVFGWEGEVGRPGGDDRRFLMLMYGVDGLNWFPAGCVARASRLDQSFMYPALTIQGDDICIISRTSINIAHHHDADYATFHRVRNFRELAFELRPEAEQRPQ